MSGFWQWLEAIHLDSPHLLKSLLAGTMVLTVCGVVGCFIVLRRTAFLADALAHSMVAGVVGGYLVIRVLLRGEAQQAAMLSGALAAGFLTVAVVGFVSRYSRVKEDAVIGIVYTGVFALGGVLISYFSDYIHMDLYHFLVGELFGVSDGDLWMMALVTAFVLSVIVLFFRQLQLISFDRVMAAAIGVPVLLMDYLLTTCVSVVVVVGVSLVGVILVVALLITPAATAYLLTDRLKSMTWLAAFFGVSSFLGGYIFANWLNVAPGSAIVVVGAAQFGLVFLLAPHYGLLAEGLRKLRTVPQQLMEDVLGAIMRAPQQEADRNVIYEHVAARPERVRRAIRVLVRNKLLFAQGDVVSLTTTGRHEARRLLRAHRLWETYLKHLGTPVDELHDRAHELEHLHDEEVVDYLDDKLGHPLRDPHGAEIPEDFVHLVPGEEISAGLLRDGHVATVLRVEPLAEAAGVRPGMTVTMRSRQDEDRIWTLEHEQQVFRLNHDQVDAIHVRLEPTASSRS